MYGIRNVATIDKPSKTNGQGERLGGYVEGWGLYGKLEIRNWKDCAY
jgi:hypothetical protein